MVSKQVKKEFIAALRSRKYTQRRGRMCAEFDVCKMCAQGVLYDACYDGYWVADSYGEGVAWRPESCNHGMALNEKLKEDLGLTNEQASRLVTMNDNYKYSFAQIADYVEKHW